MQLAQQPESAQIQHSISNATEYQSKTELLLNSLFGSISVMPATGVILCLASAAAFGAMGVFGKLAYEQGSTVATLLATRFAVAALVLWLVSSRPGGWAACAPSARRDVRWRWRSAGVGYGAQAGCYFAALDRMDASLLALVLYTFPVMVAVAAIVLKRDEPRARTGVALVLACAGIALVLAGAAAGSLDPAATALGLGAATVYTVYILTSQGIAGRVDPLALATLVCTGAGSRSPRPGWSPAVWTPPRSPAGWVWLARLAVVSTVGAIALFFAGLSRVGPTAAAILSTLEPVVTVALAAAVFGDALTPVQFAGGALVLLAAVVVHAPDAPPNRAGGGV